MPLSKQINLRVSEQEMLAFQKLKTIFGLTQSGAVRKALKAYIQLLNAEANEEVVIIRDIKSGRERDMWFSPPKPKKGDGTNG